MEFIFLFIPSGLTLLFFIRLRRNTLHLAAGMKGKVNRATCLDEVLTKSEAHQSEGGLLLLYHFNVEMATAQFRFDTPHLAAGSFMKPRSVIQFNFLSLCRKLFVFNQPPQYHLPVEPR
jgi:hypothetical protein